MYKKILICTHGSEGAQKAEKYLFEKLQPSFPDAEITLLTIIDKDWSIMSSDDWLNTSTTRTTFKDYVEEQLGREIEEDWQRIRDTYPSSKSVKFMRVVGGIEETIAEVAARIQSDLVVLGGYNKKPSRLFSVKMAKGLADTISNQKLHPMLTSPLLIIP